MKKDRSALCISTVLLILILATTSFPVATFSTESVAGSSGLSVSSETSNFVQPVICYVENLDRDFDKVHDGLENMISQVAANKSAILPVVVTLYYPVSSRDIEHFEMLGGCISYVYDHVTFGFAGSIPAHNIMEFALLEGEKLCIVEYDAPVRYHLDFSVPIINARPLVWNTYGFMGSSNHSIAILDTGIDDSHLDVGPYGDLNFSKKMVGWYDASGDGSSLPQDYGEHGTHVAGIAAGTGAANILKGVGYLQTTFSYLFPPVNYGYIDYIDVMDPGVIELNLSWAGTNTVMLRLYNPVGVLVAQNVGSSPPRIITYDTTETPYPTGRYEIWVINFSGPSGNPFSLRETYPYEGQNDGYNLFTGVAPESKLVGVKVFNNQGSGTSSTVEAGLDWIIENRLTYHIAVASMSISLQDGAVNTTLDQKVDTLVKNGIVTIVSAGNDYPTYTIGSPGTAAYVITVAATNDENGITSYSSNGDTAKNEFGLTKPDVAAPGGTFQPQHGNRILSADSNDVDGPYSGFSDRDANDYQQMGGTSMSAPHVAGLASLLVEAFGGWSWTEAEALRAKMIISMTSFETNSGESGNVPPLNRGDKDSKEGYGRISTDAAIEAATMTYTVGENANAMFVDDPFGKKVWARKLSLSAETRYRFQLDVPSGADFDLYLYNGSADSYGQPIIAAKSVDASIGTTEIIGYTPAVSGTYYLVAKWVSGNGEFTIQSTIDRDIAVESVALSASLLYAGSILNITVGVRNNGGAAETFDVTAYRNETAIGTQLVTGLAPETKMNLTFLWDTSTATLYVNHKISAEATVLMNETNNLNNICVNGVVSIKMQGDVNNDQKVNIVDLATVARAYGTSPGEPGWNPDADIYSDNIIDIDDLIIVAINYGATYP